MISDLFWDDQYSHDDIVTTEALYLIKNQPVKINIFSRDVIHDVGLPHFRMKMDAVPGTPTTMHFTPKYTTEEMRKITATANSNTNLPATRCVVTDTTQ